MVHVWPRAIANYRYDGRVLADEEEGFSEMATRGYLRHEATHSVLYRNLPKLKEGEYGLEYPYPLDLEEKVSINFGQFGPTNSRSLHEMAAIGAQLAQCEHPFEIFTFLGNTDDPDYQFARLCLTMILIKNLPQDSTLRNDCLRKFETGTPLDMVGVFDYVEQTRDLRLVQGVGLEMYNVALKLIKYWPRAER